MAIFCQSREGEQLILIGLFNISPHQNSTKLRMYGTEEHSRAEQSGQRVGDVL